jgi:hypothetical protein
MRNVAVYSNEWFACRGVEGRAAGTHLGVFFVRLIPMKMKFFICSAPRRWSPASMIYLAYLERSHSQYHTGLAAIIRSSHHKRWHQRWQAHLGTHLEMGQSCNNG